MSKHTPVNKYIRYGMVFILKGVKKRRRELGMAQLDLMAKAQLCGATITKAEGGRCVSYETASRIAAALGVKFDEIVKEFYGEDEEVCDESTSEHQNT